MANRNTRIVSVERRPPAGIGAAAPSAGDAVPRLAERALTEAIEGLAKRWQARHGREPVCVSHWNPSDDFVRSLRARLPTAQSFEAALAAHDPVPYRHSHMLPALGAVVKKLGFSAERDAALITENGTSAIAAVANWLKLNGVSEVTLLTPSYYTTRYHLRRLGIVVRERPLIRSADGTYALPHDLEAGRGRALWLTSPVYSTGVYAREADAATLRRLADQGALIVADEVMALWPTAIAQALGGHRNFVGIYAPHKSICVNGIKFAAIVFHPRQQAAFSDWAEVLSGALGFGAVVAVEHFVSPAFDRYRAEFLALTRQARNWHDGLVAGFGDVIKTDAGSDGHFLMVYVPALDARLGEDINFLGEILEAAGCTVVPAMHSGFDAQCGFCFRINLARDSDDFRAALPKLYKFLQAAAAAPAELRASVAARA